MNRLKRVIKKAGGLERSWLNPFFVAAIPAFVIILLQPFSFSKYSLQLHKRTTKPIFGATQFFEDINGDGEKEKLVLRDNSAGNLFFRLYTEKHELLGQYNCDYPLAQSSAYIHPLFTDFNKDSFAEVYVFTQNGDSLLLNCFDFKTMAWTLKNRFITEIGKGYSRGEDFRVYWMEDQVLDGHVSFFVNAGFSIYPRRLYAYNVEKDKLKSSLNTGALQRIKAFRAKGDAFFISVTHAAFNCDSTFPFPFLDTCCWIITYDKNLEIKGEPLALSGKSSCSDLNRISDTSYFFCFWNYGEYGDKTSIVKINQFGDIVDRLYIDHIYNPRIIKLNIKNKVRYVLYGYENNQLIQYNFTPADFMIKPASIARLEDIQGTPVNLDIEDDGIPELVVLDQTNNHLVVLRNNLKQAVRLHLPILESMVLSISANGNKGEYAIFLNTNKSMYELTYSKNPVFLLKFPFFVLIYLLCSAFAILILFYYRKQIEWDQSLEKRIMSLQLKNFRNQLDPHFTFNALNSVAKAIYTEDKKTAYDLFQRFTEMIRSNLLTSDKVMVRLGDELQFTEDYLEFQKTRFKEKFEYRIIITSEIDMSLIKVPKLLVQGVVENAIKHAFYNINYPGFVGIEIMKDTRGIVLIVEDNGIGINASRKENKTKGNGLGIPLLVEQINKINELYQKSIHMEIRDLKGVEGQGTRVTIVLN